MLNAIFIDTHFRLPRAQSSYLSGKDLDQHLGHSNLEKFVSASWFETWFEEGQN